VNGSIGSLIKIDWIPEPPIGIIGGWRKIPHLQDE
jgi:hypothetical protein